MSAKPPATAKLAPSTGILQVLSQKTSIESIRPKLVPFVPSAIDKPDPYHQSATWKGMTLQKLRARPFTDEHGRLNASEQRELNSRMEKKQIKEFMAVCTPCSSPSRACSFPRIGADEYSCRCTRTWSKDALTTVSTTSQQSLWCQEKKAV